MIMKKTTADIYRPAALATFVLMAKTQARAQEEEDDDYYEDEFMDGGRSDRFLEEEELYYIEDMPFRFSYRRYRHELNTLIFIAVAVLLVYKLVQPRHRRGCSIVVVFFCIIYYILFYVLRLL